MDIFFAALIIGGLIASLAFSKQTEKTFSKVIMGLQWLCYLTLLLGLPSFALIGFCISVVLILGYGLFPKHLTREQRLILLGVTVPVAIKLLFMIESWPYAGIISMLMIIPIVTLVFAFARRSLLKNEMGFLILTGTFALLEFVDYLWALYDPITS